MSVDADLVTKETVLHACASLVFLFSLNFCNTNDNMSSMLCRGFFEGIKAD